MGRPQKPYKTSWGELVPGLYRRTDGRWKIIANGDIFTEKDEYTAVARFKQRATVNTSIFVPARLQPSNQTQGWESVASVAEISPPDSENESGQTGHLVDEQALWEMVRKVIIETPELAAQKLRIPQIVSLSSLALPSEPLKLSTVIDMYISNNPSTKKTKRQNLEPMKNLIAFTKAETLADLTTAALQSWRDYTEKRIESPDYRAAYYSRIRGVIRFGLKVALNAEQIQAALTRCQILWTPEPKRQVHPTPISREDFHKLLNAGGEKWRAWLLCGLNFCQHLDEVCQIQWGEIDLDKGTYAAIRVKTQRKRIPQAATLWPETIEAIRKLPRKGQSPFVFTSTHGKRYNRNSRGNDFADLRKAAEVTTVDTDGKPLSFDWIRDGAYTEASHIGSDDRAARIMAGHKVAGLQDNYVLRNPKLAKPACDAVYKAYFG